MQNSPEATCDCCTWDVVLTRVLSTSCYIYSPSMPPARTNGSPSISSPSLNPIDLPDPSLFLFLRSKTPTIRPRPFTARSFAVLTSVPFLLPLFHDPPVIFQRRAATTTTGNNSPDGDGGPTSTDKRFTNTSTAGDISLLNYAG